MFKIIKINSSKERKDLEFKEFLFPAGESSVKLQVTNYAYKEFKAETQTIVARIHDGNDLMKLTLLKDALERFDDTPINLFMPYVPYGRQDRVCDAGESFSLKVFGAMINNLCFNQIIIVDPHSNVSEAVFDDIKVISQLDVIKRFNEFNSIAAKSVLISPDAGSNKKTAEIAGYLNHESFVRADKLRDLSNGKIKEIVVYKDDFHGGNVVIGDDLIERGGTFLGLAEELKKKNSGKISLYVTHGIFGGVSERENVLTNVFNSGIDEIWTTDSFHSDLADFVAKFTNLHVFPIETFI